MDNQLEYYDLSYQAYKRIKAMILADRLYPGQKLIQEKLAEELGVSRMPLHKAFQMLENELLVEHIPRRGIFVKKVDLNEIADAFECREAIEGLAARRAAQTITPEEIQFLYDLFSPFASDPANADLIKYEEADYTFHNTLIRISGNRILEKMEMLGNVITRTYQRGLIRGPAETYLEHMEIINALSKKDGTRAEILLKKHFSKSRDRIIERIVEHKSGKTSGN
jgi:DNA-binding GntR family transcriptional regulator